jgi:anthranilate phosphoribosyltransferase
MPVNQLLDTLARRPLDHHESFDAFTALVRGEFTDLEMAALLAAFKARGETPAEIAGAARALRASATPFPKPSYEVADSCGTGGDAMGTVNLSTAAAFVAAEAGVPVAKHGNRAVSSRAGSADTLEAAGVRLDPSPQVARRCLDELGICFLFAPAYHPGIKQAAGVRRALRTRTVFNLLGPLANPAHPEWQVMGVYDPTLVRALAETLGMLGVRAALVVHGSGLDEIALHGPTHAALLRDGRVTELTLRPEDAGVDGAPLAALAGGEREEGAAWLRTILSGEGTETHRAAVALNAGALLWVAGRAEDVRDGYRAARATLASGRCRARLEGLVELTHGA